MRHHSLKLFVFLALLLANSSRAATFDLSDWTLRIAGQIVTVNPDGGFLIPNISAPDQFGPGGPGTVPDFLSDDYLRVVGTSTKGGITLYAYTEFFRLRQGATYTPTNWTITAVPPPIPESIRVTVSKPALTKIDETAQMTVIGTLIDGTTMDLTSGELWTTYRTSNRDIVTVDANGLLTAKRRGTTYITAINDGATAVAQVDVIPGGQLTSVHGLVQASDGAPVPNIQITLIGPAGSGVTQTDGVFTIAGVSAEVRIAGILARGSFRGAVVFGRSGAIAPAASGITDAGIIVVRSCAELNIDSVDTDNDCLPDSIERALRLDPLSPDTGNQGIPDGEKDTDGDGITNCIEVLLGTDPGKVDSDGDGISDPNEISRFGTDPRLADTDGDSLSDGDELKWGTDPLNPDTDGDGWNDGGEVLSRSNPLSAESTPSQHVASDDVFYLNGLLAAIERYWPQIVVSPTVSYRNETPSPADRPMQIVASPSVSYVNGLVPRFQDTARSYTTLTVASAAVSYVNGLSDSRPETLPNTTFSLSVSYLNGLFAKTGENWFVASAPVSFRNQPAVAPASDRKVTRIFPSSQ